MYQLDMSAVPKWTSVSSYWFPAAIDTYCPFCNKAVSFAPRDHSVDGGRQSISASGRCPRCSELAHFWAIQVRLAKEPDQKSCASLLMFPEPRQPRQPIQGVDMIPDGIRRAYHDALDVFNAAVWSAAATCSGRTLEGIMATLKDTAKDSDPSPEEVEELRKFASVAQTLVTLSHSIRRGRNLGAHFNERKSPDQATAEAMLDLIDYLVEYIFVLPATVTKLDSRLASLGKESGSEVGVPAA